MADQVLWDDVVDKYRREWLKEENEEVVMIQMVKLKDDGKTEGWWPPADGREDPVELIKEALGQQEEKLVEVKRKWKSHLGGWKWLAKPKKATEKLTSHGSVGTGCLDFILGW